MHVKTSQKINSQTSLQQVLYVRLNGLDVLTDHTLQFVRYKTLHLATEFASLLVKKLDDRRSNERYDRNARDDRSDAHDDRSDAHDDRRSDGRERPRHQEQPKLLLPTNKPGDRDGN